jgi:hypothetical protein
MADKQLKGVTSMVDQQTQNLHEDIDATRRDFRGPAAAVEAQTRRAGGGNTGGQRRQSEAA